MFAHQQHSIDSSYSFSILIDRSLLLLLTLLLLASPLAAQDVNDRPILETDKPIERELAGDAKHSYRVSLEANQFLHVVVEQKGIDVVVALFAPGGMKVAEVDAGNGSQGPEPISLVTDSGGYYRLEIRPLEKSSPSGRYEVRIETLRIATSQDRARFAAERTEEEGAKIFEQDTPAAARNAIEKLKEAVALWQEAGDPVREVIILTGIGRIYSDLSEHQMAREYLNRARELAQSTDNRDGEAFALLLIAGVHQFLGENEAALTAANQALNLVRLSHNQTTEIIALRVVAQVLSDRGEKQQALDYLNEALRLSIATHDDAGEAMTLGSLGVVYSELGEYERALDYLNRALPFTLRADTVAAKAQALANIASVENSLGRRAQALKSLRKALALSRSGTERRVESSVLNSIGVLQVTSRAYGKAMRTLRQALDLARRIGAREVEALVLLNMGRSLSAAGKQQPALAQLDQSLRLWRALGDRSYEAQTLGAIASAESKQGSLVNAASHIKTALEIVETLRANVGSLEVRASYFASVQDYYEIYINVLMQLNRRRPTGDDAVLAFQVSENSRARSLLELLTEARADIRQGVDHKLVERERDVQQQLNARAQRQMQLVRGQHSDEQARTIAKEIENLTTERQQIGVKIRQSSPRYAALTQPQPLTLNEIQSQVLDDDTLLLEYSLGTDRSYLWAVTTTSITSFELPRRDEIEGMARQVYGLLTDIKRWDKETAAGQRQLTREKTQTRYAPDAAMRLSQMLLGPVAAQLGDKRLLIVADGALQYVPFAALPSPVRDGRAVNGSNGISSTRKSPAREYRPLVLDHEIVSLPSASTIAVLRRELKDRDPAEKSVAILADPVFEDTDERVTRPNKRAQGAQTTTTVGAKNRELPLGMQRAATDSGLNGAELKIARLPATRYEADKILSLVPPAERKGSYDFDASRQTATSTELSKYRYVHFATHGFLDSVHPELSGIVLSMVDEQGNPQDGFLRAHEVFNLKLPAELVVLSACQTGLGKEVKGEGLVSLTRGFMYAGAARVVVSLWSVNDEATAELMVRFYRGMLNDKLRPADALRAAQVSLMKDRAWRLPYYWAAFTIQGEWR